MVMADGTFWVSRYLQITSMTPQAKSVILDGVVSTSGGEQPNGRYTFDKWSDGFEQVYVTLTCLPSVHPFRSTCLHAHQLLVRQPTRMHAVMRRRRMQGVPSNSSRNLFVFLSPHKALYRRARMRFRADCRGKDFFDACGSDSFCSSYLGSGDAPYQTVVNLHEKLDGGQHCTQLLDIGLLTSEQLASISGMMLQNSLLRELLPAFIFRLNRCDKHDRGFILQVILAMSGTRWPFASASPDMPADLNTLLYNNIKFSGKKQIREITERRC